MTDKYISKNVVGSGAEGGVQDTIQKIYNWRYRIFTDLYLSKFNGMEFMKYHEAAMHGVIKKLITYQHIYKQTRMKT